VPDRRALLIANRRSFAGAADLSHGVRLLEESGIEVIRRAVDDPLEIPLIIGSEAGHCDLVVLGGGDGTMNLAADALIACGKPLGIIPVGTANDLARTLGIPPYVPDACRVIAAGRTRLIDLGQANGKYFFNVASIGLSAEVTRHHTGARKRWLRVLSYPLSVFDAYRTMRPFRARIRCDEQRSRVRAIQIAVGNGRHYGGGMTVAEDAAIDDGWLDVYCLRPGSFWRLLTLFPALRFGRLRRREAVHVMRGRVVEIRTRRRLPVNTDGELTTRTPVLIKVAPQALSVFVPEGGSGAREGSEP
jgi:diacylglycerol kinase (ATP)